MRKNGVADWRKAVQSALYYLVFHRGMTIDAAEGLLVDVKNSIPHLAKQGREEFRKCERALCLFIDNDASKGKTTWEWIVK